ncbi:MAG: hypothetical protein HOV71_19145 [Hamadaea sp.]|nr:hypothetical protein [Hamadaea sp.]
MVGRIRDVLVVADTDGPLHGLALDFERLTVAPVATIGDRIFDAVVLHEPDLATIDQALTATHAALTPGGRTLLCLRCLRPEGSKRPKESNDIDVTAEFGWAGVLPTADAVFAVLERVMDRPEGSPGSAPLGLVLRTAAETAAAVAEVTGTALERMGTRRAAVVAARADDRSHQTEAALQARLDATRRQLDEVREQHRGWRLGLTIARRSPATRIARGVVRRVRSLARRPRRPGK